ncbi:hypothetical protein B0T24DRAFT_497182, partial [Lasiosphaeria ovina]
DWSLAVTPKLSMGVIRQYDEYITESIQKSVDQCEPPSPTLAHVMKKRDKARGALSILAVQEAQNQKTERRRTLEDVARKERNRNKLVTRYGPVVVGDARLRAATDEHQRVALQITEKERLRKKESRSS